MGSIQQPPTSDLCPSLSSVQNILGIGIGIGIGIDNLASRFLWIHAPCSSLCAQKDAELGLSVPRAPCPLLRAFISPNLMLSLYFMEKDKPFLRILTEYTHRLTEAGIPEPRLKAELAMALVLRIPRLELRLRSEDVSPREQAEIEELIARLLRHEPWQYIEGETLFLDWPIRCSPAALIPRPETEKLAELAAQALAKHGKGARAVDIGTGTGCIAIHLALTHPDAEISAIDLYPEALALAQENASRLGAQIRFYQGDLTQPLDHKVHVLVSNPPYIGEVERDALEKQVKDYEPASALFGGQQGHEIIFRLIKEAREILFPKGNLLLEIGPAQSRDAIRYLQELGYGQIEIISDFRDIPRIISAIWYGNICNS